MIEVQGVPAFADNYIWLIGASGKPYVAIVDPGDAEPVLEVLTEQSLIPVAILITHHHGDHIGGIRELLAHTDMPVYGPAHESIPAITHPMVEGDHVRIDALGADFLVMDVPGHTRGHIAYYGHDMLFCGDTLFTGGCGRLFEGSPEQMYESLSKFNKLPDISQVYCAHEYTLDNLKFACIAEPDNRALLERVATTRRLRAQGLPTVPALLGLEKRTNPFLRSHIPSLKTAAEGFAGKSLATPAQVFATVRHWKDTLD